MLIDLSHAVGAYLHDVFVTNLDWWVVLGFVAQGLFTMRFAVQWIASERAGRSVVPMAFWWFSIGGGLLLLVYALYRRDPVFIAGQALGVFIDTLVSIGERYAWNPESVIRFRIIIEPDTEAINSGKDDPWPSLNELRPGAEVNGWVMLDTVSLGWELWRQFNAFPPTVNRGPIGEKPKMDVGGSKEKKDKGGDEKEEK